MKRDWDLIRIILISAEESEGELWTGDITGYSADVVNYHIGLLIQASLVTGECTTHLGNEGTTCRLRSLTWTGHEFLDDVRSKTTWNAIKKIAKDKGVSLSFEVVKLVAIEAVKSLLK